MRLAHVNIPLLVGSLALSLTISLSMPRALEAKRLPHNAARDSEVSPTLAPAILVHSTD
jgi:hypothetical protein